MSSAPHGWGHRPIDVLATSGPRNLVSMDNDATSALRAAGERLFQFDPLLTMEVRRGSIHTGSGVAGAGLCVSAVAASCRLLRWPLNRWLVQVWRECRVTAASRASR